MQVEQNSIVINIIIYFTSSKVKSKELRPILSSLWTANILFISEVKEATSDGSASNKDSPMSAALKAIQSLIPSPHIPTISPESFCSSCTNIAFWFGDILEKTLPCLKHFWSTYLIGYLSIKWLLDWSSLKSTKCSSALPVIAIVYISCSLY